MKINKYKNKLKGILLVNLGTPDSPETKDVRKYLKEFLMDKYVIDLPFLTRWFLVNIIIATFRAPKSAKIYKKLWTKNGSPLLYYGLQNEKLLQDKVGQDIYVRLAMRYQNPSIKSVLMDFQQKGVTELTILPLYPQYASSSTKSSIEKVKSDLLLLNYKPKTRFIENFVSNENFINLHAELGNQYWLSNQYDYVLFSYHGIPERHILKDCTNGYCKLSECCNKYSNSNTLCYRAQCFETSRRIAKAMNLPENKYSVAFQSRLETRARDPWLKPYSDVIIEKLPEQGIKNVLAFSPSFVADCLETTIEVGEEFKEIFLENGGENWQLVESLNNHPKWIEILKEITTL